MEVNNIRAPGALVEVVDVLGDDGYREDSLKLFESFVSGVWLNSLHTLATLVVEPEHSRWVLFPPFRGRHKRNGLTLPQTSWSAKGIEPALGAYARSGKYYNVSISHLVLSVNVHPSPTQELHPYRGTRPE